jgi:hypothetical protein
MEVKFGYTKVLHMLGGAFELQIFPKPLFSKNIRNNRTIGKKAFKIIHLYCSVSIVRNRTLPFKKEHCLNIEHNKDKLTGSQFVTLPIHHYQTHILCKQRVSIHSPFLRREFHKRKCVPRWNDRSLLQNRMTKSQFVRPDWGQKSIRVCT